MDLPRLNSRIARPLSVSVLVALAVSLTSTSQAAPGQPSSPTPRTSAAALTQLRQFNEEFEKVTEQYNEAGVILRQRQAEARAATIRAQRADADYRALTGQLKRVVVAAYQSVPFSRFGTMLTSDSPRQFLDQLSALDTMATRRAALVDRAARTKAAAVQASAEAQAAAVAAGTLSRQLAVKKTDLAQRAAQSKALFDRLSAQERAAFLARQEALQSERASRSSPRTDPSPAPTSSTPAPAPTVSVPASGRAAIAVATAKAQLGKPYVWGSAGPDAFDCSGLTLYSWAAAGVSLPHSSSMQINVGSQVSRSQLQPGDLVFFYNPIHHVGIYVGSGMMIHAPTSNDVVKYAAIDGFPWAGASRPG